MTPPPACVAAAWTAGVEQWRQQARGDDGHYLVLALGLIAERKGGPERKAQVLRCLADRKPAITLWESIAKALEPHRPL